MKKNGGSVLKKTWQHFLRKIIAGLLAIVPLGITFIILRWLFRETDSILRPAIESFLRDYYGIKIPAAGIPGAGFLLVIIILYILGIFSTNYLGKKVWRFINNLALKTPIVSPIYNMVKQIIDTISMQDKKAFQRVIMVKLLGSEMNIIGFVTGSSISKSGQKLTHVFIPTTPNPTSGYLQLLTEDQIVETDLSVEEGIKMVISGGVISPEKI